MSMTFTLHAAPSTTASTAGYLKLVAPRIEAFTRDTPVSEIIDSIKLNGGARIKGFLTPEEVASAASAVRPHLDAAGYARPDDQTKRLGRLPEYAPALTEKILTDSLYLSVMDTFLSVTHTSWLGDKQFVVTEKPIVAMSSIFEVGPGMHMQDLHRDDAIWYTSRPAIEASQYKFGRDTTISFFIAGSRTTRANGATRVVPGSHLQRSDERPNQSQAIDAELDAGDAFFMLSSVYHGAGQNSTEDEKRLVYALFMQQPHLRQEENFALYLPHDIVRAYPLEVQRRLGYDVALPNLGWVDHASPLESVLKQKGADRRAIPGYNPIEGVADGRAEHAHESRVQ
ncbi:phytanoyl-dioxygenase family protein [Durotheca rogersii]|uniref:phytanoyl-dioxygenase family protein n=1 Tax=Durotheca rogersii TaxID=419775 RepID=UPI00221E55B0|nr:phytanoyl-dioxygenase family protein [Durotheca rogersii]KAI5867541.1 phytanoyl-dioxygenase family protein [Durotheca rogersii]